MQRTTHYYTFLVSDISYQRQERGRSYLCLHAGIPSRASSLRHPSHTRGKCSKPILHHLLYGYRQFFLLSLECRKEVIIAAWNLVSASGQGCSCKILLPLCDSLYPGTRVGTYCSYAYESYLSNIHIRVPVPRYPGTRLLPVTNSNTTSCMETCNASNLYKIVSKFESICFELRRASN